MNYLQKMALRFALKGSVFTAGMSWDTTNPDLGAALARVFGTNTYTGKTVNEDTSLKVTTFVACMKIISETMGVLSSGMFQKDRTTGNYTYIEHDLTPVLTTTPNADMTSVEYLEATVANIVQQGNAFSLRDTRKDGTVFALYPVPTGRVTMGRNKDTGLIEYDINDRGKWVTYPQEKIWHIKGFGTSGLAGLNPLIFAREALSVSLASEEFQARFFANGASPSMIVSVPQWLTPDQRVIARENLDKLWGGLDNAHKARLLEGGMKTESGTMPLQEAQFKELRDFSVHEICRIMRIPPHMVAELTRSTNNNIEQQSLEFVRDAIMPYTNRIEKSVTKWLIKPEERSSIFFRFNLDSLMRADAAARATLHGQLAQNGAMSRNEIRALEGRNQVLDPAMDMYTVQSNLVPIGRLEEIAMAQAKKNQTPAPPPPEGKDLYLTVNTPQGEHKTQITNLIQTPDQKISVPQGNVTVEGAKINVEQPAAAPAPEVKVVQDGLPAALVLLGELVEGLRKAAEMDSIPVRDSNGKIIASTKVAKGTVK